MKTSKFRSPKLIRSEKKILTGCHLVSNLI
nr:MAG TPA: hypothetical protein [Caudoviricetes sp.]